VRNTRKTEHSPFALPCLLYREILVPGIVAEELTRNGAELHSISCLAVREPSDMEAVLRLQSELDAGESAAIVLALEVGADMILADERKGRKKAAEMGLEVVGLLGVISEAKRKGLIPACRPVLDALEREARFWISPRLRNRFVALAGE
jgi:predicted nucleic acid-binding protein